MQRHCRRLRETLHPVPDHLAAQITQLLTLKTQVYHAVGPGGDVEDGPGEGFVEGSVAAAEAGDGCSWAEGFREGGTEGEEGVFYGVVVVDCEERACVR